MKSTINQLFKSKLKVINLGLAGFKQALDDARVPVVQVEIGRASCRERV